MCIERVRVGEEVLRTVGAEKSVRRIGRRSVRGSILAMLYSTMILRNSDWFLGEVGEQLRVVMEWGSVV